MVSQTDVGWQIDASLLDAHMTHNKLYKRFLYVNRVFRQKQGADHIDLFSGGTFERVVPRCVPTERMQELAAEETAGFQRYPSSFGADELIMGFAQFLQQSYGLHVDLSLQLMVCPGVNQAIDAVSRALQGSIVFVPALSVPFSRAIPVANGARLVPIRITREGRIDPIDLECQIAQWQMSERKYLYLNYPNNPTGAQASLDELATIVSIAQHYDLPVVHDHDICFTTHSSDRPVISILQVPNAEHNCIEVYTFSKEFGLSGLRVGMIAGSASLVHVLQLHNYEFSVMTPRFNQLVAAEALSLVDPKAVKASIQATIRTLVTGLQSMGWGKLPTPDAGIAFMLPVPEAFVRAFGARSGELFAFYMQERVGIGVGPGAIFGSTGSNFVRFLAMAPAEECAYALHKMAQANIAPDTEPPEGLSEAYEYFISHERGYNS